MTVQFHCPRCERLETIAIPLSAGSWCCPGCREEVPTFNPWNLTEDRRLGRCALCGGERFYTQRDFNQRIGCLVAGLGAALSPFTYGLSLLVCLAIDLGLYFLLKQATVCYRCGAVYRGIPIDPHHKAFDLHVAAMVEEERKFLEPGSK
ncbi:MAG TPA: hypothetical protein VKL61_00895 [Candidatus Polarisedimenticolia bacterium]|nr:hypothetical protein [Candidatus Polarisedimenticolia bacterium]